MVIIAQLVELPIVIRAVEGSSPFSHPISRRLAQLGRALGLGPRGSQVRFLHLRPLIKGGVPALAF